MQSLKNNICATIIALSSLTSTAQTKIINKTQGQIKDILAENTKPQEKNIQKQMNKEYKEAEQQLHDKIINMTTEEIIQEYKEKSLEIIREHTLIEINRIRDSLGLSPLKLNTKNNEFIQNYVNYCDSNNIISHTDKEGKDLYIRTTEAGIKTNYRSEILAKGTKTIKETIERFMTKNSPHREKIVSPKFQEIGIGEDGYCWGYFFTGNKEN